VEVGELITYTFTVTNTGNIDVTGVTVDDTTLGVVGLPISPSVLTSGSTGTVTFDYALTQSDIDAGAVYNTAIANGTTSAGPVSDDSEDPTPIDTDDPAYDATCPDCTVTPLTNPQMELYKIASVNSGTDGIVNEGDVITYTFTVENTGNVTIEGITVSDIMLGVSNLAIVSGTLDPTESGTVEVQYAITASDIVTGRIENTATANGLDPYGDAVTDISDDPTDGDTTDANGDGEADGPTVTLLGSQMINLTKDGVYTDNDSDGVVEVGELITYTFTVTNTGNIDVTGVTVDDTTLGVVGLPISPSVLTSGSTGTVTFDYALTQSDIDAGAVYNTAIANGSTSAGPVSDDSEDPTPIDTDDPAYDATCPDCTVTPLTNPQMELHKTASVNPGTDGIVNEGDIITYTFTVENTGNVTIEGITVSDIMLGVSNLAIVSGTLDPTESGMVEVQYAITASDIVTGRIENTATANGLDPYGDAVTDISDDPTDGDTTDANGDGEADGPTVTLLGSQMINLTKDGVYTDTDSDGVVEVGELITYTFTVTNTGNIDVTGVTVDDTTLGVVGLPISPSVLTSGSTGTVTFDYALTQSDIDAGAVYNTAIANGSTSAGPVSDDSEDPTPIDTDDPAYDATCPDCTVTPLTNPQMELYKTASMDIGSDGVVKPGDIITYTFTVKNTGNVVIDGITITDTMLGVVNTSIVSPLLIPGQVGNYTFDYRITAADIIAGSIVNTATVNGIDIYGNSVTDVSDDPNDEDATDANGDGESDGPTVTILPMPMADIVTVKDDGQTVYIPGTDLIYTITVTNNGPSDADNVVVSDPLPSGITEVVWVGDNGTSGTGDLVDTMGTLENGATVIYTVTLSVPFEFTGDLTNVVSVTSDTMDPDPGCPDCTDTNILQGTADIGVTKEASVTSAIVDDVVTFTITTQNFGPQTATNIVIEEILPSGYEYISHVSTSGLYDESTGLWSIDALAFNGIELLEVTVKVLNATDYTNVATLIGVDQVDLNDSNDSDEVTIGVVLSSACIEIYSTFTPHNEDGINDFFTIDCIENYPDNTLKIYNRWGYLVYSANGYNNTWDGISNGPRTINEEDKVPVGTYYYVLDLGQGDEPSIGWLYVN